ncbi:MAG: hypothetical protein WCF07_13780, partial [Nitrososphaeraceae archaeon]
LRLFPQLSHWLLEVVSNINSRCLFICYVLIAQFSFRPMMCGTSGIVVSGADSDLKSATLNSNPQIISAICQDDYGL